MASIIDFPPMAELTADMLHRALGAFANQHVETVLVISQEDDQVDHLYNQVYRELLAYLYNV